MNNSIKFTVTLVFGLLTLIILSCGEKTDSPQVEKEKQVQQSARPTHWGYGEENGPDKWASLDQAYSECEQGHSQSPIDIKLPVTGSNHEWKIEYGTTFLNISHNQHVDDIIDNGHTIQVDCAAGSKLTINNKIYELKQFHFHTPSENTVDGKHHPMEMHMVHKSEDNSLAVYAVFFNTGKHNDNFNPIVSNLPNKPGEKISMDGVVLDISKLLPKDTKSYHFMGSLTTPPCTENVNWVVAVQPVELSADQINEFSKRLGKNNRPTQPLNDRVIAVDNVD